MNKNESKKKNKWKQIYTKCVSECGCVWMERGQGGSLSERENECSKTIDFRSHVELLFCSFHSILFVSVAVHCNFYFHFIRTIFFLNFSLVRCRSLMFEARLLFCTLFLFLCFSVFSHRMPCVFRSRGWPAVVRQRWRKRARVFSTTLFNVYQCDIKIHSRFLFLSVLVVVFLLFHPITTTRMILAQQL